MKQIDTGPMPVSPSLQWRLAFLLSLATWPAEAVAKNAAASHRQAELSAASSSSLRGNATAAHQEPVVRRERKFYPFGSPRYPDDHPELTWRDLSGHSRGKLGHICQPGGSVEEQCGGNLVCRREVCRHCISTDECPSLHHCLKTMSGENFCVADAKKAWEKVGSDPYHLLCTILIFFSSVLSAAAGTGGGGMFVPLLVLFAALKAESAVALSQCMIFCSSFCNLALFVAQRHTTHKDQPKIDYDCIVTFEPMLCFGVTFGVLLNRMSPQWFILLLLCCTLCLALWRTATKGLKQMASEKVTTYTPDASVNDRWDSRIYAAEIVAIMSPKSVQAAGIFFVWLLMFIASFHGLSACSWQFGVFFATLAVILILCTFVAVKCIITRKESAPKPVDWSNTAAGGMSSGMLGVWTYPAVAFGGGALGGLLGLGGGVIMSPVLLEVGMHTESVQATTAVIVFLSSSLATIQFALVGQIIWHYALWYSAVTVLATCMGQHLCEVYVRRTGRYSLITLSIAGVLFFSLIALSIVGTQRVIMDITYGQQIWWSTARLCGGGHLGILDVDVTPAQAWPSEMPGDGLRKFFFL